MLAVYFHFVVRTTFQITSIYVLNLLAASASTNYLYLSIPNDMLIHGPIIQNVSNTSVRVKTLICNPLFPIFRDQYLTDEMKQLEKVTGLTMKKNCQNVS